MVAEKTIEILEDLKRELENTCHTSMDANNIEALDMAITILRKGWDLANENDALKRELSHLSDEHKTFEEMYAKLECHIKSLQESNSLVDKENQTLWKVLEVLNK